MINIETSKNSKIIADFLAFAHTKLKSDTIHLLQEGELMLEYEKSINDTPKDESILVGYLTQAQGFVGYKKMEIGHPVYELKDKYFMIEESIDGKTTHNATYYKEDLKPVIKFI